MCDAVLVGEDHFVEGGFYRSFASQNAKAEPVRLRLFTHFEEGAGPGPERDKTHAGFFRGRALIEGVAFAGRLPHRPVRLRIAQKVAHHVDDMGAVVHQAAGEITPDQAGFSNGAFGNQVSRLVEVGALAVPVGNDKPRIVLAAGVDHRVGFVQTQTHGLFAQYALCAGVCRGDGLLGVDLRVGAYADEIDVGLVLEEVLVRSVAAGNVQFVAGLVQSHRVDVAGGNKLDVALVDVGSCVAAGDVAAADEGRSVGGHNCRSM